MRARAWLAGLFGCLAVGLAGAAAADHLALSSVQPSQADPTVRAFDEPNIVLVDSAAAKDAPLVVFLPGTDGAPGKALGFLSVIAQQGYRVIGLEYDDAPSVSERCPRDPNPACSAEFRRMRVDGDGPSTDPRNPPQEAIIARLTALLRTLDAGRPDAGWGQYLKDGRPAWDRIIVTGLSQGAGMAAYIAKHHAVQRVVLFSSPWDVTGPDHAPAPWLSDPSQTPPDRWYAEYHARENTARLIVQAYAALAIPPDHIRVFNLDLPVSVGPRNAPNPYHGSTIHDARYAPEWRAMFGTAAEAASR